MAKQDEYIEEAYDELKKLSADEKKRLEYEARERAMLDYNTQIKSARNEGRAEGEQTGINIIKKMREKGMTLQEIADFLDMDIKEISALAGEMPG